MGGARDWPLLTVFRPVTVLAPRHPNAVVLSGINQRSRSVSRALAAAAAVRVSAPFVCRGWGGGRGGRGGQKQIS